MVARINTVAFHGIEVQPVDVQVQIASGMPTFNIVGLPDKAVAESKERVRSALHALGLSLPPKRLTINLAPADLIKEGSHFDLPIALGLLAAMDILPKEELEEYVVLGELSLDASIRRVTGVLPTAMFAYSSDNGLICPKDCGGEAAWAGKLEILAPRDLLQLINHIKGTQIMNQPTLELGKESTLNAPDLSAVKGQETAKRAIEIAAAGGHNLLMVGPPGSGKSMLSSCLPAILPPLTPRETLEVSMIHSLAGILPEGGIVKTRPFRDPHHSASLPALVGGGHRIKPGEVSLAHNGVLFLDELPEFSLSTLESMRQPLEIGETLIARANQHIRFPARFQLIAAMNPCRCGHLGDADLECTKAPKCGVKYQSKISGPLLDRIDMQIDMPTISVHDLNASEGESSTTVATRVANARNVQLTRTKSFCSDSKEKTDEKVYLNAHANGKFLDSIAILTPKAKSLLDLSMENTKLSARSYFRILRVARTIADLAGVEGEVQKIHMAEALSYRRINYEMRESHL